jgi:hypothetical protein
LSANTYSHSATGLPDFYCVQDTVLYVLTQLIL